MKLFNISIYWWIKTSCTFLLIIHVFVVLIILEGKLIPVQWQILIGQFLALLGVSLNLSHYYILKKENSTLNKPIKLVTSGLLFNRIRHPMYLGELILISGLLFLVPLTLSYLIFATGFFSIFLLAKSEDKEMENFFSDDFKNWKFKTGLLLPKINLK